jgi:hypothetical protein
MFRIDKNWLCNHNEEIYAGTVFIHFNEFSIILDLMAHII